MPSGTVWMVWPLKNPMDFKKLKISLDFFVSFLGNAKKKSKHHIRFNVDSSFRYTSLRMTKKAVMVK
jgi:hypothetical protein